MNVANCTNVKRKCLVRATREREGCCNPGKKKKKKDIRFSWCRYKERDGFTRMLEK